MRMKISRGCPAAFMVAAVVIIPRIAMPADLLDVYKLAAESDPGFRQVLAAKQATLELRPQAIAGMLPSTSFQFNTFSHEQDIESEFIVGGTGVAKDVEFNSHGYSLDVNQPLFRVDRILQLRRAGDQIQQADAQLTAAHQDLLVRVTAAYFNVLAAGDSLQFAQAEKRSLSRQLEQAKQRFEVGLTAITDVQEAQAGFDRAFAQEIAAENALDNAHEALREITGTYVAALDTLGNQMPLAEPSPPNIDDWTRTAVDQNADVIAALHAVDAAREQMRILMTGHLPTLDLVLRHGSDTSGGRFGSTIIDDTSIGLQLNVPIFQGGLVNSRVREARERLDEQLEVLERVRREAHRLTREAYLGVMSGISQIQAFDQALVSSETALQATQAGFEVGTRTAVDVVAAERGTFEARRDLARAKYDYILNIVRLKQAAGTLSDQDLMPINSWLE